MRTLGSVAGIIPERQQVHHSIRRSLDSHDTVEVEAAIYAAMQFAAQSKYVSDVTYNLHTKYLKYAKQRTIPFLNSCIHMKKI